MAPLDEDFIGRFSEALVQEIWTEMGRNRITSVRALAMRMGRNHQYVTARLKHDPKTGKPVPINVVDLFSFAEALDVEPGDLMKRAAEAAGGAFEMKSGDPAASGGSFLKDRPTEVSEGDGSLEHLYDEPSAAHPEPRNDVEGDLDPDLQ